MKMKNQIINILKIGKVVNILIILVILIFLKIPVALAQSHEFSVYGSSGFSSLRYQISKGARSDAMGADFGVGYTFVRAKGTVKNTEKILHARWGIHTGIGLGLFNARAKVDDDQTTTKSLIDSDNHTFDLTTFFSGYNESQKTMFLNIPVMAVFKTQQFYVMGGFKFGIPLVGKYEAKKTLLINEAYYPEWDNWAKTQTFAGDGAFRGKKSHGNLNFGVSVSLAFESGIHWRINENLSIYSGAFFDYGLNNVARGSKQSFINYDHKNPENFTTNSILSSYSNNDSSVLTTFTGNVSTMAIGIKVRLAFDF